jgi:hypothetical protein
MGIYIAQTGLELQILLPRPLGARITDLYQHAWKTSFFFLLVNFLFLIGKGLYTHTTYGGSQLFMNYFKAEKLV